MTIKRKLNKAQKLISKFGGAKKLSDITGISVYTCKSWRSGRREMPEKKYIEFLLLFKSRLLPGDKVIIELSGCSYPVNAIITFVRSDDIDVEVKCNNKHMTVKKSDIIID